MNLKKLSGPIRFPWLAIDFAIANRERDRPVWIVHHPPGGDDYVVCIPDPAGELAEPLCQAFIGVFVETDRFTDPVFRINLGPGVWPMEDE